MNPHEEILASVLLEAAPDAMLVVNASGEIVAANRETERLFGYKREELLGQRVELLVPPELHARHREHRESFGHQPSSRSMGSGLDLVCRRKDGSLLPVEISLSPVSLLAGGLTIATIRDISDRIRHAEERQALSLALEMERERQRIAMDLHDGVMQDIYAISLGLEIALARVTQNASATAESIDKAIEGLHDVVRDIRNHIFDLRPHRFSGELSHDLARLGDEFSDNTSIRTSVSVPAMPSLPEEVALALYNITHEALSNIRKYSQAGEVSISVQSQGGLVRLEISDDGVGFDTSESTSEAHRGLRNMAARARDAGGAIKIESTPGQGTVLEITFPLEK